MNTWLNKKLEKAKNKTRNTTLPGFYKHSIYDVVHFFIDGLRKGSLTTRASSVAFNFVLAMFPGIIFLFTLIPYIPIPNFQSELLQIFESTIPESAYLALEETLEDIILEKKWGLLSFGAVFSLFFSMNGIHALIGAFNATYHDIETRSWLTQRLISIMLVFILFLLVTTAIFLIVASRYILDWMVINGMLERGTTYNLILFGRWVIIIIFHLLAISFLYYLAPAKKRHWRFLSPGSIMAAFLTIIASLIFSSIINNFGQFNNLYGSIGTLMVALLWTYFNSLALIIGFELNASISNVQLKLDKNDKTQADIRNDYLGKPLSKKEIHPNPLAQFNQWLEEAINAEIPEPTAMSLSTANTRGQVNSRIVLLKEVEENGFIFYTNYKSRKGQDLAENPFASITFFWAELFRQVRIEGSTEKVSPKKSDEYFNSRPEDSRISALVSEQSQEIPDRKYLERQFETLKKKYNNQQITRPEHWGGYILYPDKIEFWQGRLNRLHDRIQYEKISNHWKIRRLAP